MKTRNLAALAVLAIGAFMLFSCATNGHPTDGDSDECTGDGCSDDIIWPDGDSDNDNITDDWPSSGFGDKECFRGKPDKGYCLAIWSNCDNRQEVVVLHNGKNCDGRETYRLGAGKGAALVLHFDNDEAAKISIDLVGSITELTTPLLNMITLPGHKMYFWPAKEEVDVCKEVPSANLTPYETFESMRDLIQKGPIYILTGDPTQ